MKKKDFVAQTKLILIKCFNEHKMCTLPLSHMIPSAFKKVSIPLLTMIQQLTKGLQRLDPNV